jgi:hypothetical protein
MSITAKELSKTGARSKAFDLIVREQISVIDSRLQKASKTWGRNVVACELPIVFPNTGLDVRSAQRIVYSTIIQNYKERGFGLRILLQSRNTTLYVEWVTDIDPEAIKGMNRLIKSVSIQPGEVDEFLDREK